MAQLSSPLDKLIALLQQRLSPEDIHVIADDYGERSKHEEKNYSAQKKSLSERLVDKAGDAPVVRLLVLHAMYHKDVMGLLHLIFKYRPDLQQPVHALGFERTSLIRAYLVALLKEMSGVKASIAEPLALQYRVREPAGTWSEVSLNAFLGEHSRVVLQGATATERTMTLQRLFKRVAADWQAARATAPFPVLADMRRWFNPKMSLVQFLQAQMSWLGVPQLAEQLPDLLGGGCVVLLLDGLDELPYSKRSEITGLRDDPRIRSVVASVQEKAQINAKWVIGCQGKDFLLGPRWCDLYVFDPRSKDVPAVEDAPTQLLKAHIEQALEREVVAGRMSAVEATELQSRLGYLALNMTYPELRRERRGLFEDRQNNAEKELAAAWLFHLRKLRSNDPTEYSEPEASPEELQQADRLLKLAEAAGLLVRSSEGVRFAHEHIQHYFIISYCRTQFLDDPQFLARVSSYEFRDTWPLWREFDSALVDKLLALLQNAESSSLRSHAAHALSWCSDSRAVNPLIAALKDEDADVRWYAAFALGTLGDHRAVEALIVAYEDTHPRVRESALRALAKIAVEDDRSIELLIKALGDEDAPTRYTAVSVVEKIRNERLIEPLVALLADSASLYPAKEVLIAFGQAAVPALMVALIDTKIGRQYQKNTSSIPFAGEGRGEVSYNAAEVLGEIGDIRPLPLLMWLVEHDSEVGEAHYGSKVRHVAADAIKKIQKQHQRVAPLVSALQSNDSATHIGVAFALGLLGDQRAVEPLLQALQNENKRIRWGAANLLGRLGDARAIVPLLTALTDEDSSVSSSAADALQKFGELAIVPLIAALKDESLDVRAQAVRILGSLRNKQAVEPIIPLLKDQDHWVRLQAVRALGLLGDKRALEPLVAAANDPHPEVRKEIGEEVHQIDPDRAAEVLIAALQDKNRVVRYWVANALVKLGDSRAVEPLITALKDEYSMVREYAAYALMKHGDQRAVEPLIENLQDREGYVALAAARALGSIAERAPGSIGDSQAIEALITMLKSENQQRCTRAAEVLIKFGESVTPVLIATLKDEGPNASFYSHSDDYWDWSMRVESVERAHLHYYAADILGKVGDTRALPILLWLAENDKNETVYGRERVQDAAAEAVKSIMQRHQDAVQLVAALDEQDAAVRVGAAFALGLLNNERATEVLVSTLTNSDRRIRWGAVHLLGEMGGDQAILPLISAFEDEDSDVRNNAVAALTKIGPPAMEALIAACREENSASRERTAYTWIAYTLGQIGKNVPQLLLTALEDQDSNVRYWIARALGYTFQEEAIGPLRTALQDEDVAVRLSAASALVLLGNAEMRELVHAGLKDADVGVRFAAIENLLAIPDAQATEPLITVLEDENRDLRYLAVMALGRMGDSRALPALERLAGIRHSSWNPWDILFGRRQRLGRRMYAWRGEDADPQGSQISSAPEEQDTAEPTGDEPENQWEPAGEVSRDSEQAIWQWPSADEPEGQEKATVEVSGDQESGTVDDSDVFANWELPPVDESWNSVEAVESNVEEEQVDDELRELAKSAIERIKERQK